MYLRDVLAAQKRGVALGVTSVCSAHPEVLRETLRLSFVSGVPALIESTCNQVNQFGGYTGLTPERFAGVVGGLATELGLPAERVILGGDHLGPSVWRHQAKDAAMQKAAELVRACVEAGFAKLHLDCSMRLADDPPGGPSATTIADRAAQLARVAENCSHGDRYYVIGTEVPLAGGATAHSDKLHVTAVADVHQAVDLHREAFARCGLDSAWDRVLAIVVQPGVEFGDDFVIEYRPAEAADLSEFIESHPMVFEAHSTDYQSPAALKHMVRDHFAILKVGPALTFAYREAVFALATLEDRLLPLEERSNLIQVVDRAMLRDPSHWRDHYVGTEAEQAVKRRYSLSDRVRYYWPQRDVQAALRRLRLNLGLTHVLPGLIDQLAPEEAEILRARGLPISFDGVVSARIAQMLQGYAYACSPAASGGRAF